MIAWIEQNCTAWETSTGKELWTTEVYPPEGSHSISPNGKWLVGKTAEGAALVDVATGKIEHNIPQMNQVIGFSADDRVVGLREDAVVEWTLGSDKPVTRIEGFRETPVGFSAARGLLVSAVGHEAETAGRGRPETHAVRLWSLAAGKELTVCLGHSGLIRSAVITPDGKFVISGSLDGSIR